MTRMKKYAVILVAIAAIGLLWAYAAWAQPGGGGDRPRDEAAAPARPNAPPDDAAMDDPPPGPPDGGPADRPERPDRPRGGDVGPAAGPGTPGEPGGPERRHDHRGAPPGMMPPGGGMAGPGGIGGPRPGGQPVSPGYGFRPMMPGSLPGRSVRDPEMVKLKQADMELEQQSQELAMAVPAGAKEEREKIKKQIIEVVNKQFDVRQQRRLLELKRMEEELETSARIVGSPHQSPKATRRETSHGSSGARGTRHGVLGTVPRR